MRASGRAGRMTGLPPFAACVLVATPCCGIHGGNFGFADLGEDDALPRGAGRCAALPAAALPPDFFPVVFFFVT